MKKGLLVLLAIGIFVQASFSQEIDYFEKYTKFISVLRKANPEMALGSAITDYSIENSRYHYTIRYDSDGDTWFIRKAVFKIPGDTTAVQLQYLLFGTSWIIHEYEPGFEQTGKIIYLSYCEAFSDKIASDPILLKAFLSKYLDTIKNSKMPAWDNPMYGGGSGGFEFVD